MTKPKVNVRAWEPIEKRKQSSGKDTGKNAINWEGSILDENRPRANSKKERIISSAVPLEDRRNKKDIDIELIEPKILEEKAERQEVIDHDKSTDNGDIYKTYYYQPAYDDYGYSDPVQQENNYQIAKLGASSYGKHRQNNKNSKNSYLHSKKKKRKKIRLNDMMSPELLRTIGAGVSAILLGVVFGYAILNYFVKPVVLDANEQNIVQDAGKSVENQQFIDQVIPGNILYYLQAGVFSEFEGAQRVQADHINNGRAAVIAGDGPFRVFIGVSSDKASADKLKDYLSGQGMDLYVKEFTSPAYKSNASEDSFNALAGYLTSGETLVNQLSQESIAALASEQHQVDYTAIQKLHQDFLIQAQQIKSILTEEGLTKEEVIFQALTEEVNYAIAALRAYEKTPNPQYLWNVQSSLLKYKLKYEELPQ